ncbi:hypothetical protein BDN71DRAFT_550685 [Pleurotus eryngii]|uniref:BTB domain-containing protein n=1 Tax=Pleurotus eryngii TaxID=5323 RepID=A0A9P6D1X8_PLEER|nr:hypothetical protein BDN71DRAFT_550685 [Pleurotus eryngii]
MATTGKSTRMHDKQFYYSDGSLVLSAHGDAKDAELALAVVDSDKLPVLPNIGEDSLANSPSANEDIIIYFRIHRSLLVEESTVIKDMFLVGSSAEHELYDGTPLIALHDKASDVRGFLRAIYKPLTIFLPRYSFRTTTLLRGPLLLAVKYQADAMKEIIISHLRNDWPDDDYDAWKKRGASIPGEDPAPEALLRLARTAGCTEELRKSMAIAYYILLSVNPSSWDSESLETADFMSLIQGRSKINLLFMGWVSGVDGGPEGPGPLLRLPCIRRCQVATFKEWLLAEWSKCSLESMDIVRYLDSVAQKIETAGINDTLCSAACRKAALKWVMLMAKTFYERLEDIFFAVNASTSTVHADENAVD